MGDDDVSCFVSACIFLALLFLHLWAIRRTIRIIEHLRHGFTGNEVPKSRWKLAGGRKLSNLAMFWQEPSIQAGSVN